MLGLGGDRREQVLTALGLPALLLLIEIPLALGLVPPNGVYGYRTEASRASPEAWYAMNAAAGWIGAAFAVSALAINTVLLRRLPPLSSKVVLIPVLVFAGLTLAGAGLSFVVNG